MWRPTPSTGTRPASSTSLASPRMPHPRTGLVCRLPSPSFASAAPASSAAAPPPPSVGIDLGTTNSCIAVVGPDGTPALIPVPDTVYLEPDGTASTEAREGAPPSTPRTSLPSVVAYLPGGGRAVGGAARRRAAADPANTVQSAKRLMGRSLAEVTASPSASGDTRRSRKAAGLAAFSSLASAVPGDPSSAAALALALPGGDGEPLLPEAVAADVLRALLAAAAAADAPHHRTPTRAVVSVPAHFSAPARAATLAAARSAGLTTVRLVREPVAAAIGYGVSAKTDQTVLVLDLGGGTFDVALLEVGGSSRTVEVLAAGGDPALGGDDWDAAIVGWLGSEHVAPAGTPGWASQPPLLASLRSLAEAAKVALSYEDAVKLTIPVGAPPHPVAVLTRSKLDELAGPLYSRAAAAVDAACFQAGVELGATVDAFRARQATSDAKAVGAGRPVRSSPALRPKQRPPVSRVLLVGAPTKAPGFRAFVRNLTGLDPENGASVDPDAAVALGAAVQAAALDAGSSSEAAGSSTSPSKKQATRSDLVVLDVFQGALARALAVKALESDNALADRVLGGEGGGSGAGRRKRPPPTVE